MDPLRTEAVPAAPPGYVREPRPKFQNRVWLHALLFLLTVVSTTLVGIDHFLAFRSDFLSRTLALPAQALLANGLLYSAAVLAILGAHEFGHYFACRYYDVDASLPYFLPFPRFLPLGNLTGTFGAVIRIREPMQSKRVLFDVGVAGPIAGFAVAVPALILGIGLSNVVRVPSHLPPFTLELGDPLLFRGVSWLFFGSIPDGYTLNMHPIAWAAWFGLLATAMNLFPVGQLDGGHLSYAVFGRRSTYVTFGMLVVAAALIYFSPTWLFWTLLMGLMIVVFGPRHPRTIDELVPLDPARRAVAWFALVIFVVCFTPAPLNQISTAFIR